MADDPVAGASSQDSKPAPKKARRVPKAATSWLVPLVTAAILASGFFLYYFVYVAAQREYLANRNFRSLAELGAQVQEVVSIHGSILEFAADLADRSRNPGRRQQQDLTKFLVIRPEDKTMPELERDQEARKDYLKYLSPSFELIETSLEKASAQPRSRFDVRRRNGRWELFLTAQRHERAAKDYSGSLEIDTMLAPFVRSLPFDDIMLVSEQGTVVYQSNKAGPQFTTLSALLEAQPEDGKTQSGGGSPAPEGAKKDAAKNEEQSERTGIAQNRDPIWRSKSKHLADVTLAGTRYKVFLQPILVDVFNDEEGQGEPAREWIICGLKSAKGLDWEALSISPTFIIWFIALFLLVLLSGPILKLMFMNKRERFRLRELAYLGLTLVLLTGVLTFCGLEAIVFPRKDDTEIQLQQLGDKLSGNIHLELQQMRDQLQHWCAGTLRSDLKQAEEHQVIRHSKSEEDSWDSDKREDPGTITPPPAEYPYVNNAFWTDDDGIQIVKWSTSGYLTPMIDVSQLPLYAHPQSIYLDGKGPGFYFDSVRPPNKLEYLAGIAMPTRDCNPAQLRLTDAKLPKIREDVSGGTAILTAQPLSLIDPILPLGYGFALVDQTGNVLFHSDKTKNLHENFLQESEGSRQLYAAAFGHAAGRSLTVKYLGLNYSARVMPVPGVSQAPWSLIVYRDLTSVRTLNLQAMTMVTTLILMVLAVPVLVIALWCLLRRPLFAPEWLWPNPARLRTYRIQSIVYAILILIFLALGFAGSTEQNVIACVVAPGAALLATIWCFRAFPPRRPGDLAGRPEMETGGNRWSPLLWRKFYFLGIVLVLLLMGVLIPMALFRATLNVERRLAVKQAQLHLASAVGQRLISTRDGCEKRELSAAACEEFRRPDSGVWGRIVLDPLFPEDGKLLVRRHKVQLPGKELYSGWLQNLVYLLHHDYNEGAAEMLGVIPDREIPSPGADWAWENDDSRMTLRWHGVHLPAGDDHAEDYAEKDLLINAPAEPPSSWAGILGGVVVGVWVTGAMGLIVWALIRRIFLFRLAPVRTTESQRAMQALRDGKNVVLLLPPAVSNPKLEMPTSVMDIRQLATAPTWAEDLDLEKVPVNLLIEVQRFEYATDDAEIDNQKFVLIDRLKALKGAQFAVIMRVPASPEDYRRRFPDLQVIDLRDEPFPWLKKYEGPARDLIWNECGPLPPLWPIGAQLADDLRPGDEHLQETVIAEMLERADEYYHLLWEECSPDQKFALAQLAQDGLPNPTNGRAIRQLASRGLIVEDPQFRIVNESFRRFLYSHTSAELKREWQRESRRTGWGKMHGAFFTTMLLTGAFLLTTQNELWQSSAAYVTTALGALGTFTKLFNTYRGGGAAAAPEKAD